MFEKNIIMKMLIVINTVAHNCHIKTKSLTSNSNRSQQIQIAHSKFISLTANYKSLTANYKSLTAI